MESKIRYENISLTEENSKLKTNDKINKDRIYQIEKQNLQL